MRSQSASYHGFRFPPDIITHAVWLYYWFCLSFRDADQGYCQVEADSRFWCPVWRVEI